MSLNKIFIYLYYLVIAALAFICSTVIPFQQSEDARIEYTNKLFVEYKQANNLQYVDETSEVAKSIRNDGHVFGKAKYKELSGKYGLFACAVALFLTLLMPFSRSSDLVLIGASFAALYGLGALTTESFIAILLLTLVAYSIQKWKISITKKR
ncbi:MAG: hypothetical protein PHH47_02225 [Gallionella sp.]|nr:hypothetical protein [Gallionella sp.]MDD4946363.1 hypothetical protein [Gallionella sp.]MDD5612556.1 hypothetical protein [Gallionella sp.]